MKSRYAELRKELEELDNEFGDDFDLDDEEVIEDSEPVKNEVPVKKEKPAQKYVPVKKFEDVTDDEEDTDEDDDLDEEDTEEDDDLEDDLEDEEDDLDDNDDLEAEDRTNRTGAKASFGSGFMKALSNMGIMEGMVALGAVAIVVMLIFIGVKVTSGRSKTVVVAPVGQSAQALINVEAFGTHNIEKIELAAKEELEAKLQEEERLAREQEELEAAQAEAERTAIKATINYTSIEKDIKIKFLNSKTNKLLASAKFKVTLTTPSGKTLVYTDDDMDGIIYQKGLEAGKYTITIEAIEGYSFAKSEYSATIKDKMEYVKVDVADEVKSEDEVNVKVDDTETKQEVEVVLKDTVAWVEPNKIPIGNVDGYAVVDKKKLVNPEAVSTVASASIYSGYVLMGLLNPDHYITAVQVTQADNKSELNTGETLNLVATLSTEPAEGAVITEGVLRSSSDEFAATVTDGVVTAGSVTTDTLVTITATSNELGADNLTHVSGTYQITIKAPVAVVVYVSTLSLSEPTAMAVGATQTLLATETETDGTSRTSATTGVVTWESSDTTIAIVDAATGLITAKKAGTVTITAKTVGTNSSLTQVTASKTVTVTNSALTVDMPETLIAAVGVVTHIPATVTLNGTAITTDGTETTKGHVKWSSSDVKIAKVDENTGAITPLKAGSVTITAEAIEKDHEGKAVKDTCVVTVSNAALTVVMNEKMNAYVGEKLFIPTAITINGQTVLTDGTQTTKGYVTWVSSDTTVATIDAETGMITPIKEGTTVIKATSIEKDGTGKVVTDECTVKVLKNPKLDNVTLLKTTDGVQVYVKKDNAYVKATYADYYTAENFYIASSVQYKYTGWQTIDGKTYYFTKDGEKVTGTQVILGVQYNFSSDGVLNLGTAILGIDVSSWNGNIDWKKVKEAGVSYVIIRTGFRGSSTGALVEDKYFKTNIKGAIDAGLKVGVYFFSQAISEAEAIEEASMVLNQIKSYKISYPIFIDIEASGGRADSLTKAQRTAVAKAFCNTVKNAGYDAGVYSSTSWFTNKITASDLSSFKIWVAQYNTTCTYTGRYDIWQFSSKGSISGISGNVDLNYSYMGY